MSEIEDIADTLFNQLQFNLGKLNSELNIVEWSADGQDRSEELLGIVWGLALSTLVMALCNGRTAFRIDLCRGLLLLRTHSLLAFHDLAFITLMYTATLATK